MITTTPSIKNLTYFNLVKLAKIEIDDASRKIDMLIEEIAKENLGNKLGKFSH